MPGWCRGRHVRRYADRARPSAAHVPAPAFPIPVPPRASRSALARPTALAVLVGAVGVMLVGCGGDGGPSGPRLSAAALRSRAEAACGDLISSVDPLTQAESAGAT